MHRDITQLRRLNPKYKPEPFYRYINTARPIKDASVIKAAVLALLPSLGHIYLRRWKRSFAIALPFFLFVLLWAIPGSLDVLLFPMLILWIWQILDAAMCAKHQTSRSITKAAIILFLFTGLVFFIVYNIPQGLPTDGLLEKCLHKAANDGGRISKYERRLCKEDPTNPDV